MGDADWNLVFHLTVEKSNGRIVRVERLKYKNVYNTDGKLLSSVGRRTVLEGLDKGTEKVCYVDKYIYDDKEISFTINRTKRTSPLRTP